MTQKELNKILALHQKWLQGKSGGKKADLSDLNLNGCNLVKPCN